MYMRAWPFYQFESCEKHISVPCCVHVCGFVWQWSTPKLGPWSLWFSVQKLPTWPKDNSSLVESFFYGYITSKPFDCQMNPNFHFDSPSLPRKSLGGSCTQREWAPAQGRELVPLWSRVPLLLQKHCCHQMILPRNCQVHVHGFLQKKVVNRYHSLLWSCQLGGMLTISQWPKDNSS